MADVTQWATHAIASAQATVADGVAFVWTESTRVTDGLTQKASALLPSFIFEIKSHSKDNDASDLTVEQMEQLMAQTHDAEYPVMPNAPIIVAAASCQDVLIRWKSLPDVKWPLHGYVLQRFPDLNHTKQWATILETNATDVADHEVRASQHYVYRLQTVSGQARSPFAYQAIILSEVTCCAGRSLLGFLPAVFGSVPGTHWLSNEAIQTLVLICACFLAVFGVMRSSVTRMQSTRSRQGRLRRMQKSALAESCLPRSSSYGRSSSSESSTTEPATEPTTSMNDHQSSSGSVRFDLAVSASTATRRQSLGALSEPSSRSSSVSTISADPTTCCHFCRKKFGVFRRRFVCEACQSVSLCRKCGIQAAMEPTNGHAEREIRAQPRIHMICKDCCAQPQRYSTAASVRPSFQPLR